MHFPKKKFTKAFFCLSLLFSGWLNADPPSVLVIGHGFMGANHVKNLEILQQEQLVKIAGIVDIDAQRLKDLPYPSFVDTDKALETLSPDIVVIASNTKEHFDSLIKILNLKHKPALFIEKPLVETSAQAKQFTTLLKKEKNANLSMTCGYLFRQSPIIEEAIRYIQEYQLKIESIDVVWQKKRAPTRPSAGVHMDEATHPVDLILNQLLPALNIPSKPLSLLCTSRKYDDSIIDRVQQAHLYHTLPEKLVPLAEVSFAIHTPELQIQVLSSFMKPPQRREIRLICSAETELNLIFDKDQSDLLEITTLEAVETKTFEKPNKLLIEWRAFLDYYREGNRPMSIPSLTDMVDDIAITEMLDSIPLDEKIYLTKSDEI